MMSCIEPCSVGGGGGEPTAPLCEAPADVNNTHYSATFIGKANNWFESKPTCLLPGVVEVMQNS